MNSHYATTTHIPADAEQKARCQDDYVLQVFTRFYLEQWTASRVYHKLIELGLITHKTPESSIKRSISTLKKKGVLLKTEHELLGEYDRHERVYELSNIRVEQGGLF